MPSSFQGLTQPPISWHRLGCVLPRGPVGSFDSAVTGDPCIVWDQQLAQWRMFYFAMVHDHRGAVCNIGQAVCRSAADVGPGSWEKIGPVQWANPRDLLSNPHKPAVLIDPRYPNQPALVDNRYWLLAVVLRGCKKCVQAASGPTLAGPWQIQPKPILEPGPADAFDGYHAETVTAWWFPDRQSALLFYKGYPLHAQPDQPRSPWGSSNAPALWSPSVSSPQPAQKLSPILKPSSDPSHWTAGWIGGLQLFPARAGGWFGLFNASPTPPVSVEQEKYMREPAPSLGGWAHTPQAWPISGWKPLDEPIERIASIPPAALQVGEGTNLWRHHALLTPDGKMTIFYNTGSYGREQMFARQASL
ncbi:MAG: hypothetical protein IT443_02585 [Phycisphaeraceae bacterium]|nr:hypothetical protein [Phycisphaeraceae bacterium]